MLFYFNFVSAEIGAFHYRCHGEALNLLSAFSTNLTFTVTVSGCLTKKDEEKGQSNFGASGKQFPV